MVVFSSGCLKFSEEVTDNSSRKSSSSGDSKSAVVESNTYDFRPMNTLTLRSSDSSESKLKSTYITVLGNGAKALASGFASDFGLEKSVSIRGQHNFDFIVVREIHGGKTIETRYGGNNLTIDYELKL